VEDVETVLLQKNGRDQFPVVLREMASTESLRSTYRMHLLDIKLEVDSTRPGGGHAKLQYANIVKIDSVRGIPTEGRGDAKQPPLAGTYTIQESAYTCVQRTEHVSIRYPSDAAGSAKTYRGSRPEFDLKDSQTWTFLGLVVFLEGD
jgi:hypothetical protein